MVQIGRLLGGLAGAIGSVVSGSLGTYLVAASALDDGTKAHVILAIAIASGIAVVGFIVFGTCEYIENRERGEINRRILEYIAKGSPETTVEPVPIPISVMGATEQKAQTGAAEGLVVASTLRQAGFDLAKEMRDFEVSIPRGSREEEFEAIFPRFLKTFYPRLATLKDRFEVVLPKWSVQSAAKWLPTDRDTLKKIANDLEQDANRTSADILL